MWKNKQVPAYSIFPMLILQKTFLHKVFTISSGEHCRAAKQMSIWLPLNTHGIHAPDFISCTDMPYSDCG